jgi:tetratricopeptide (TPR) repeat protein
LHIVIGSGVMAGIIAIVVLVLAMEGDSRPAEKKVVTPPVQMDATMPMIAPDAAIGIDAAEPEPDADLADEANEIDAGTAANAPGSGGPKPSPKPNAAELTKQGLNAMVRGDNATALQLYRAAQRANPAHAPAWRQAGLLHEKLGDHGAAKAAFQRYLILSPNASDAAQIRARLANL